MSIVDGGSVVANNDGTDKMAVAPTSMAAGGGGGGGIVFVKVCSSNVRPVTVVIVASVSNKQMTVTQ